ncbi:MAG: hypothetical protein ABI877_23370, partial [Gemmatimonadaceae bacterium]
MNTVSAERFARTKAAAETATPGSRDWTRGARLLFSGHLGLIAFSTVALTTILNGPPGPLLQQEPNATIMRLGWAYSGPTYVVLGALAALAHAIGAVGKRRALTLFAVAS